MGIWNSNAPHLKKLRFIDFLNKTDHWLLFNVGPIIIIRAGKPVAEVKPVLSSTETLRPYGLCAAEFTVPDDFDAPFVDRRGYSMRDAQFWMKITKRHKRQGARHKVS
jgi:hypothetical protein